MKSAISFVTQQLVQHTKNGVLVNDKLRVTVSCAELEKLTLDQAKALINAKIRKEYNIDFSAEAFESSGNKVQSTYEMTSTVTGNEFSVRGFVKTDEYQKQLKELKEQKTFLDELKAAKAQGQTKIEKMKHEITQLEAKNAELEVKISTCQSTLFNKVKQLKPEITHVTSQARLFSTNNVKKVNQVANAVAGLDETNLTAPVA